MSLAKDSLQKRRIVILVILALVLANCLVAMASKTTVGDFIVAGSNFKGVSGANYGHKFSGQDSDDYLVKDNKDDKYGAAWWVNHQLASNSSGAGGYSSFGNGGFYGGSGSGSSGFGASFFVSGSNSFLKIAPLVLVPSAVVGSSGSGGSSSGSSNSDEEVINISGGSEDDEASESFFRETSLIEEANPVPEPISLVLMGTGLSGLLGFRKKFKG